MLFFKFLWKTCLKNQSFDCAEQPISILINLTTSIFIEWLCGLQSRLGQVTVSVEADKLKVPIIWVQGTRPLGLSRVPFSRFILLLRVFSRRKNHHNTSVAFDLFPNIGSRIQKKLYLMLLELISNRNIECPCLHNVQPYYCYQTGCNVTATRWRWLRRWGCLSVILLGYRLETAFLLVWQLDMKQTCYFVISDYCHTHYIFWHLLFL